MKILVVDDHTLIREGLRRVLGALEPGVEVIEAADAASALACADAVPDLDLVLLDLNLPGGGFTALAGLRHEHPAVPVVVLSACAGPAQVAEALDRGALGFIPKSADSDGMLTALRRVLAGDVWLPSEFGGCGGGSTPGANHGQPCSPMPFNAAELGLTERQLEVLRLLVEGKPNKVISRELDLAEGTVKVHVTAILKALHASNRTQAVILAGRLGLTVSE